MLSGAFSSMLSGAFSSDSSSEGSSGQLFRGRLRRAPQQVPQQALQKTPWGRSHEGFGEGDLQAGRTRTSIVFFTIK